MHVYIQLAILTKGKREKTQITRIINETKEITTSLIETERIIKEYLQQLYASKLDSLNEMHKYLGRHKLQKLT